MIAELAPPWGKFGHPSGKVRQGLLLYSQTSVVGIANGQENVTALINICTIRVSSSEYKFTKNEPKNVVSNCPSFRLAFWASLFFV